jgi:hypothetical protein
LGQRGGFLAEDVATGVQQKALFTQSRIGRLKLAVLSTRTPSKECGADVSFHFGLGGDTINFPRCLALLFEGQEFLLTSSRSRLSSAWFPARKTHVLLS